MLVFTEGKKEKSVNFLLDLCVRAILTFVSFLSFFMNLSLMS